jgi:hypothetical protein
MLVWLVWSGLWGFVDRRLPPGQAPILTPHALPVQIASLRQFRQGHADGVPAFFGHVLQVLDVHLPAIGFGHQIGM